MDCSFRHSEEVVVWYRPMLMTCVTVQVVQATLDTGCSHMLLRAGLILDGAIEWCKLFRMRCIHGGADQYKRGYVDVQIANWTGRMKVGFAPDLDGEMIIGWDCPLLSPPP